MDSSNAIQIVYKIGFELEESDVNGIKTQFSGIANAFQEELESAWKVISDEAGEYVAATAKDMSTTWDKTQKDLKSITTNALSGTVTALFKGDMDDVGDIWESAWDSMIDKADSLWSGFLDRALDRAFDGLGNIFNDLVVDPALDWLGDTALGWAGDFLGSYGGDFGGKISDFLGGLEQGDTILEALDSADIFGGGMSALGLDTLLDGGLTSIFGDGLTSLFGGGGVPKAISDGWGITSGVTDMGVVSGPETGNLAGMFSLASPAGAFAIGLAPGMIGMMFNEQISGLLGMSTGMEQGEAQDRIANNLDFVEAISQLGGTIEEQLPYVTDLVDQMDKIATTAGYSSEQIDAMVASLSPAAQELVEASRASNTLEEEVRQLAQEINAAGESMTLTDLATKEFNQRIDDLAERLGLGDETAQEFRETVYGLADSFTLGGEEAVDFEQMLDRFTQGTLTDLTEQAEDSRQAIEDLKNSLNGEEGAKYSAANDDMGLDDSGAVDRGRGDLGYYHGGGYVRGWPRAHAGAWISSLARDEVPIIARRGEYVVRSESVTANTLPALKALNLGAAPAAAPAITANFTININGNVMGNDDQIEDMARVIETRLRKLQNSRWRG